MIGLKRDYEELGAENEFKEFSFPRKVYNLSRFGLPWVPVIGRVAYRKYIFPESNHVHKGCTELIYCLSGACEYECGGERYSMKPGRVLVFRADEPHRAVGNPRGYAHCYLLLKNPVRKRGGSASDVLAADFYWLGGECRKLPRIFNGGRSAIGRFNRLFTLLEAADMPERARQIRIRSSVMSLLLGFLDATSQSLSSPGSERIAAVAEEMRAHPERAYSLESLALRLSLSSSAILEGFKDVTGFPPHAFLVNCRIERAKAELSAGVPVKTVAKLLGYPSAQHFSLSFKNATGLTPGKWA